MSLPAWEPIIDNAMREALGDNPTLEAREEWLAKVDKVLTLTHEKLAQKIAEERVGYIQRFPQ